MQIVIREMFVWKSKNDVLWVQFYLPSVRLVGADFSFKADFRFRLAFKPRLFAFTVFGFGVGFDFKPTA